MSIEYAETRDRTGDFQIFSLTLSQLSYRGCDIQATEMVIGNLLVSNQQGFLTSASNAESRKFDLSQAYSEIRHMRARLYEEALAETKNDSGGIRSTMGRAQRISSPSP